MRVADKVLDLVARAGLAVVEVGRDRGSIPPPVRLGRPCLPRAAAVGRVSGDATVAEDAAVAQVAIVDAVALARVSPLLGQGNRGPERVGEGALVLLPGRSPDLLGHDDVLDRVWDSSPAPQPARDRALLGLDQAFEPAAVVEPDRVELVSPGCLLRVERGSLGLLDVRPGEVLQIQPGGSARPTWSARGRSRRRVTFEISS